MFRTLEQYATHFIHQLLQRRSKTFHLIFGLVLIACIGFVDYSTGHEIAVAVFYLVPVAIGTWYGDRQIGLLFSLVSASVYFIANWPGHYSIPAAPYSNTIARFAFFVLFTTLLDRLQLELQQAKQLARTDSLTGVSNWRAFSETAHREIQRMNRIPRPLTVAYLDLDNFKQVNDQFGHSTGDELLIRVADILRHNTRCTDVVARLGGDEFVLLLPETNAEGARAGITKLRLLLLEEMHAKEWPVTFSIGVVTFHQSPEEVDMMVKQADAAMYLVKRSGKNQVQFSESGKAASECNGSIGVRQQVLEPAQTQ